MKVAPMRRLARRSRILQERNIFPSIAQIKRYVRRKRGKKTPYTLGEIRHILALKNMPQGGFA